MAQAIKLTKPTFKKIESEWFGYHDTLKEIAILREEIMNPFQEEIDENVGGDNSGHISKPTEQIATRLSMNKQLNYLVEIVEAIEKVYNALPDDYKKMVQLRYWSKHNNYTWEGIGQQIGVSERQARRWRHEVVQATSETLGWR